MQRFYGDAEPLGEREVGVIAATSQLGRDGHILEPAGMDLTNFRRNPIVLFQHLPDSPVGTATAIGLNDDGNLAARITFAPHGASVVADQCCALVKAGIVRGVSIGFDIDRDAATPLDPRRPNGGLRIKKSELLEISFVSIPADTGAGVTARSSYATGAQRAAMFRGLPEIGPHAIARAASYLPAAAPGGIVPHAVHVWALQEASRRDREQRDSKPARLARLAELRERAKNY